MPRETPGNRPRQGVVDDQDRPAPPGDRHEVCRREQEVVGPEDPAQAEALPGEPRPALADDHRLQAVGPRHPLQPATVAQDDHRLGQREPRPGPLIEQALQASPDPRPLGREPLAVDHQAHRHVSPRMRVTETPGIANHLEFSRTLPIPPAYHPCRTSRDRRGGLPEDRVRAR